MKNTFFFTLAAVAVVCFFSACENNKPMQDIPQITIEAPEEGAVFAQGDTVHIEVEIEHTEELHEYLVELKNASDGTVLFSEGEHSHDMSIHVHDHWVNNVQDHSDMELVVTATDHEDKSNTKTLHFHCLPN